MYKKNLLMLVSRLCVHVILNQVEKVVSASNPDRFEIEKAKKMLKV